MSPAAPSAPAPVVKIYGMSLSTCTRRVLVALEEKGVPYEVIPVSLMKGEQKMPDHLAKQPFGVIPAMEHGDVHMFESRAIARYVARTWADQGTDLLGKDAQTKALTDTWLDVEFGTFNPPMGALVSEKVFKKWRGATEDEVVVAAQTEKLNKVLDVYESVLKTRPYLAGQEVTLADLSHLPYGDYLLNKAGVAAFDKHPAVKAWWDRISSRPTWVKVSAMS